MARSPMGIRYNVEGIDILKIVMPLYGHPRSPSEKHGWRVFGGMMGPVQ